MEFLSQISVLVLCTCNDVLDCTVADMRTVCGTGKGKKWGGQFLELWPNKNTLFHSVSPLLFLHYRSVCNSLIAPPPPPNSLPSSKSSVSKLIHASTLYLVHITDSI